MRSAALAAALGAAPAAAAAPRCAAAGVVYNSSGCTAGGNYNESSAATSGACCAWCGAQPRCYAWTFHPAGAGGGQCYVSDKPEVKHNGNGATCGCRLASCGRAGSPTPAPAPPPSPAGQCAAAGVVYNSTGCTAGGNYNQSLATTAAACCARCGAQPRCYGWTFHPAGAAGGRCDLSDKPEVKQHENGATCGCRLPDCGHAAPAFKYASPDYEPKNITITKAEMTYPYSVYTDLVHDWEGDGLPEYFGANDGGGGEACPPQVRYKCEPCGGSCDAKAKGDEPYHRKCGPTIKAKEPNNSSYCEHWSITLSHMKQADDYSINKRKGIAPMTRRQILERATGWIAMGFAYKTYNERPLDWGVSGLETCAKTESPNAPLSPACPQYVTGDACCGFAAMAWQTEECARLKKIPCGSLQPGDSISAPDKNHIMIFRRWMDDKNSSVRKYQSGGGHGMCNAVHAPRNPASLCYTRHNIVREDGSPESPETFDFATYPHVLAFVRPGDMHRVPLHYRHGASSSTPGHNIA